MPPLHCSTPIVALTGLLLAVLVALSPLGSLRASADMQLPTRYGYYTYPVGPGAYEPFVPVVADLNGDHIPDIVVADNDNALSILLGCAAGSTLNGCAGTGTFQHARVIALPNDFLPNAIAVGDVNGDTIPDLVVGSCCEGPAPPPLALTSLYVFLRCAAGSSSNGCAGAGTFQTPQPYLMGSNAGVAGITIGDFNGDTLPDLAVISGLNGVHTLDIYLGCAAGNTTNGCNGRGTFQSGGSYATGANPDAITTADLNGDHILDLAVANRGDNTLSVFLGCAAGSTTNGCNGLGTFQTEHVYSGEALPDAVAVGNFNGDTIPDLAVAEYETSTIAIRFGCASGSTTNGCNGVGTFSNPVLYTTGEQPQSVTVADVNDDGIPDLVTANVGNDNVSILLGCPAGDTSDGCNGIGTFQTQIPLTAGQEPNAATLADIDTDQYPDIVIANFNTDLITVLLSTGGPTAARVSHLTVHRGDGLLTAHWRLVNRTGVAGFDLVANGRLLNRRLIPVHRSPRYRYSVRWTGKGQVHLEVVGTIGRQLAILPGG